MVSPHEIEKGKVFHNGLKDDKYKARKVTGYDNVNGVNYIDIGSGRIGNCSIGQFAKWAKGEDGSK